MQSWADALRKPVRTNHVAIYIRWSTEEQGEGTTEAEQRETVEAYVRSQGWRVTSHLIFVDAGCSGGTLDRPAMSTLRGLVAAGEIDCVCAMKVDRLSRSVRDIVHLVLDEWEGRCHFRSAREPIDTTTQVGKFAFYLLASFSEWERETIRERTLGGKIRRAREGKHIAKPPFGYRLVLGHASGRPSREIVPEQAAAVREAFTMAAQGLGCRKIARWLTEHGYRTAAGLRWGEPAVRQMLKNPAYCGLVVYGRTHRNPLYHKDPGRQTYTVIDPDPIVTEGGLPPIITREDFEAVQAGFAGRLANLGNPTAGNRAVSSRYLLGGLLQCDCLTPDGQRYTMTGMVQRNYRSPRRPETLYYACKGYHGAERHNCRVKLVRMEQLDAIVLREFLARYGNPELRRSAIEQIINREVGSSVAAQEQRKADLEQRLGTMQRRLRRFADDYGTGELSARRFEELAGDAEAELERMRAELLQVNESVARAQAARARLGALQTQFTAVDQWDGLTIEQKKELLRAAIHRIVVSRPAADELHVEIQFQGEC